MKQVVRVPFRFVVQGSSSSTSFSGTAAEVDLVPTSFDARLADMSDDWQRYRFTKLHVEVIPPTNPVSASPSGAVTWTHLWGVAFDPTCSGSTGTVGGFPAMAELTCFDMTNIGKAKISVDRKVLLGNTPNKWYETKSTGSPTDQERYQGTIYYFHFSNTANTDVDNNIAVLISGECEFCDPADPTDTVVLRAKIARAERLLAQREAEVTPSDSECKFEEEPVRVPAPPGGARTAPKTRR